MTALDLVMDGTVTTTGEFDRKKVIQTRLASVMGIPKGTHEGQPTVMLRLTLPDGKDVFMETTLRLFVTAAKALEAYYQRHHGYVP